MPFGGVGRRLVGVSIAILNKGDGTYVVYSMSSPVSASLPVPSQLLLYLILRLVSVMTLLRLYCWVVFVLFAGFLLLWICGHLPAAEVASPEALRWM